MQVIDFFDVDGEAGIKRIIRPSFYIHTHSALRAQQQKTLAVCSHLFGLSILVLSSGLNEAKECLNILGVL